MTMLQENPTKIKQSGISSSSLGLKRVAPYWTPLRTMAKGRWINREILEMVSTEFRDRSIEYYRFALEAGVTSINGKIAKPGTIIRNGDCIQNIVHRHEPPVTSSPIELVKRTPEYLVVNKPGSIPVHGVGRYYKQTLVYMLREQYGIEKVHTVNRLDRLTSGLLILPLVTDLARSLGDEFVQGKVKKEYIARCRGLTKSIRDEVFCNQPLLTVDRQMGLNVVHPQGKPAQTIFKRMFYDSQTDTSVLHCRPLTGRSHQIRVHLQYLGFPIANDPVYNGESIWGRRLGRGGVDIVPSEDRAPPTAPDILLDDPQTTQTEESPVLITQEQITEIKRKLLPRETGQDIGMGSPVPLSSELVNVITRLRKMKDENEDWSRWRDVVFRGQKLDIHALEYKEADPQVKLDVVDGGIDLVATGLKPNPTSNGEEVDVDPSTWTAKTESGTLYCKECYLPLYPDPDPEDLYTTECLGSFETQLPDWAKESWTWSKKEKKASP
ncbi:hypothetical protein Clacol_002465 [Clathrus columnatus]|uniref:Pseudouridine synthase n=1 Tax=Clathrus columnatus TaxID=1419009 RepID=A0AAV5A5K7_9AGAM|nr:hypothetical protein Clacol_002465 [Clathrus columnatus]